MKFENTKKGDTVYVKQYISYGWHKAESFTIPVKVERVAKTQLVIEGGRRFKKTNGDEIASGARIYSSIHIEGDKMGLFDDRKVYDQTKEMNEFHDKINLERSIKSIVETIKFELNTVLGVKELTDIREKLNEIKSKLNEE